MVHNSPMKPRGRGRPRKFEAQSALDAALEVFRTRGYSGTSLDDLSAATGLNRPSLYGAFGNKQAMFEACVEHYWSRVGRRAMAALFATGSLERDLRAFFAVFLDVVCASEIGGCVIACALPADVPADSALLHRFASIFEQSDQVVAARLLKAVDDGQLPVGAKIDRLAKVLVSLVFAISLRARAGAKRAALEELMEESVALVAAGGGG
jgi:AcrR family transcriptional regulator